MREVNDILVVDDDMEMRLALAEALKRKGYSVSIACNGKEALEEFGEGRYRMVISDVKMPGMDGMEVLREIKRLSPTTPVLLVTAFGTVEKAVEAVKEGAVDFILKPFTLEALEEMVEKALKPQTDAESFQTKGKAFLTRDPVMRRIISMAMVVAESDATVLITGESGTGKELMARFIHEHSKRKDSPFVAVNCAAIPEGLLESELFGHEKGAFTGALNQRQGKFEQANTGTLLLDEISEMDLRLQAKLLRVIQEKEVERLGGKNPIPLDIRIIATTNRDLKKDVKEGRFREDLYYRLNIFPIDLPPLRERKEDIVFLAEYFMKRFSTKYAKHLEGISKEAIEYMEGYHWKGNIRELENTIERAVLLSSGKVLEKEHLVMGCGITEDSPLEDTTSGHTTLREMERELICRTLQDVGGNRTKAARILGISVRTLRNKLKEYGQLMPEGV